jgi:hypothetical protein
MLFDLRARGRRRTVQVVYVTLALLLGGGLVLFGIGGDVQGGLFDAFREDTNAGNDQIEKAAEDARKAAEANPQNPRVWAVLAEREYQLAGQSDGFDEEKQLQGQPAFEGDARERLVAAERAWDRHLRLAGDNPNANAARIMINAFDVTALNKPDKAVRATEIDIESKGDAAGSGDYVRLAILAWQAGQTRKGDLASTKAVDLAPKDERKDLKSQLDAQKATVTTQGAQGAGAGGTPAPAPSGD